MIRILIVEDSPTLRMLLKLVLESDPDIQVVGTAVNGEEGVRMALALKPDLITMDIRMPVMDGFEATRRIMEQRPTPIVVISSNVERSDMMITFNAIKAGALEVLDKAAGLGQADGGAARARLITTVKLMADVKVIRRYRSQQTASSGTSLGAASARVYSLLAIGASTGGPAALNTLLRELPAGFALPVVVVQHMTIGFTAGLVAWLQLESALPIKLAEDGERICPGTIYFAPDDTHIELIGRNVVGLNKMPPVNHVRPSATILFESVARVCGSEAIGVLLTGMGEDGARGLMAIRDRGGATIAQDEATSAVYGMPKAAVELGAVDQVLPLPQISGAVLALTNRMSRANS